jgi:type IV pilus assembly protein PilB
MFAGQDLALYALLKSSGAFPRESLEQVLDVHQRTGRPLAELLVETGGVTREQLLRTVASRLECGFLPEAPARLDADTLATFPADLARRLGVVPLEAKATPQPFLAMDPLRPILADELAFSLGRRVQLVVADPGQVEALLRHHYGASAPAPADADPKGTAEVTAAELETLAAQQPVVRFVNEVLMQAVRDKASDIHFEPFEREFKVRYRIDGALCEMPPPPRALVLPVVSRLKVLANLDIAERRIPQDGRIRFTVVDRAVDLRISTLPTQFGESVVLRVLDQSALQLALGKLTMPADIERAVREIIRRPSGIFVVTGPTGSGKTTTLYSCLREINRPEAKVLTVEDPVEYELGGVMQVPVNPAADLTFARALRSFLRQDPDIVMVGEIRDLETAQIAIQASLTGHLVLTTLHTNDAPATVTRLVDMGIEPFLLASTLEAVLAQRLVRRLCRECREAYQPGVEEARLLGPSGPGVMLHRAKGCAACQMTGYRGRFGLFELMPVNDTLRDMITGGTALADLRRQAESAGMTPLRQAARLSILAGDTTLEEAAQYL